MPITITITDPTPAQIAALFGSPGEGGPFIGRPAPTEQEHEAALAAEKPKATRAKPTPKAETAEPVSLEDDEMAREIAADIAQAEPEPVGATQTVDAGTGKPLAPAEVTLTMDEVRANATRLAQADSSQLKAILGQFGAAKLSEVAPDALPDFAARVLAALG